LDAKGGGEPARSGIARKRYASDGFQCHAKPGSFGHRHDVAESQRRQLATLGGSDDLRNQYLLAIVTDCAIGPIGPFPAEARAALNGREVTHPGATCDIVIGHLTTKSLESR
jgi:hypothetical protein